MGYSLTPQLVRANRETLEAIMKVVVEHGEELMFDAAPEELAKEQYKLFQLLKAAEVFHEEFGGKFVTLKKAVKVRLDGRKIVVRPKEMSAALRITPRRRDEKSAVQFLAGYSGNMAVVEFFPSSSFSLEEFQEAVRAVGWEVYINLEEDVQEDGSIRAPADRVEERESVMKRMGF